MPAPSFLAGVVVAPVEGKYVVVLSSHDYADTLSPSLTVLPPSTASEPLRTVAAFAV